MCDFTVVLWSAIKKLNQNHALSILYIVLSGHFPTHFVLTPSVQIWILHKMKLHPQSLLALLLVCFPSGDTFTLNTDTAPQTSHGDDYK